MIFVYAVIVVSSSGLKFCLLLYRCSWLQMNYREILVLLFIFVKFFRQSCEDSKVRWIVVKFDFAKNFIFVLIIIQEKICPAISKQSIPTHSSNDCHRRDLIVGFTYVCICTCVTKSSTFHFSFLFVFTKLSRFGFRGEN